MPSSAYKHFRVNMIDVYRLIEAHEVLSPKTRGKKALAHITRSSVVTLCACWEEYVEAVLIEGARYLKTSVEHPKELPRQVQKNLAQKVKTARHDLKPLELAGTGWEDVYYSYCREAARGLNTPKTEPLNGLYFNYLGIKDVQDHWINSVTKKEIDNFVSLRGEIAHKGRAARYVYLWEVQGLRDMIYSNVKHMDNSLCGYLHKLVGGARQPWRRATK